MSSNPPPNRGRGRARGRGMNQGPEPPANGARQRPPPGMGGGQNNPPPQQRQQQQPQGQMPPAAEADPPRREAHRGAAAGAGGGNRGGANRGLEEMFQRLRIGMPEGQRHLAIRGNRESLKELARLSRYEMTTSTDRMPLARNRDDENIEGGLFTNAFRVMAAADFTLFQYVFYFEPAQASRGMRVRLVQGAMGASHFSGCLSFDGMNGWSSVRLPNDSTEVVTQTREGTNVTLRCVLTGEMPRESPTTRQMLNVVLRDAQAALGQVEIRRNYYQSSMEHRLEREKLCVWPGFSTTIDDFLGGRLLVLDVAHTVLRSETVLDQLKDWQRQRYDLGRITGEIVGQSVLCRHNNRHYVIHDVDFNRTPNDQFENRQGTASTFVDYYREKYGINNIEANQPLLVHRPPRVGPPGQPGQAGQPGQPGQPGQADLIYLIPQLCYMTGITDQMRTNYGLMASLSQFTRPDPTARVTAYNKFTSSLGQSEAAQRLSPWGLRFETELVRIENPRKLRMEKIEFGGGAIVDLANNSGRVTADWSRDMKEKRLRLKEVRPIGNVLVICPKDMYDEQVRSFLKLLETQARNLGAPIQLSDDKVVKLERFYDAEYFRAIQVNVADDPSSIRPDFIIAIIKPKSSAYIVIKRTLTCVKGVPSQCIVANKKNLAPPRAISVANKIAIQMMVKTGSIPWSVNIPTKTLMVVGIDVFHSKTKPSVLAFLASVNPSLTSFFSQTSNHASVGEEVAATLESCMTNALREYHRLNNALPDQIFVYRDGVGEGQLKVVRDQEVNRCLQAATTLKSDNPPKLVYTIVTKRVPQRFLEKRNANTFVNPGPGTVVDTTVTRVEYQDFFLISQETNQGTISPSHYNIIFNQSSYNLAIHQKLAYKLCHLYYNWQGTVKVPAPVQSAHKLAYLVGENFSNDGGHVDHPHRLLAMKPHFL